MFEIKTNSLQPAAGKILLSEPLLRDFYFRRAAVLLAEHNEDGSFGVILNKPLKTPFNEIVQGFPDFQGKIYIGGPVSSDRIFYLHTLGDTIQESFEVMKGLYWGGNINHIKELAHHNLLDPKSIRFFVGYSGWSGMQLQDELKSNSWVVAESTSDVLLSMQPANMWNKLVASLGKDYEFWKKLPIDPILN